MRESETGRKRERKRQREAGPPEATAYVNASLLFNVEISPCSRRLHDVGILSLNFTRAQFFDSHAHFHGVHSAAAGPLPNALYTAEQEG